MNKREKPSVTVIVPTYHDWDRLQLCLNALDSQTYPKECFEIIIVNNDPLDKAPSTLFLPENCLLLEESKPGSYAARNKALKAAKGDFIAFTDSDCQPDKNWLEVAISFLNDNQNYDRVGGNIKLFSRNEKWNWFEIYELFFAFPQEMFVKDKGMAATGNMISRKIVFDQVGLFNERLMSGGDGEWGERANSKNFKIKYLKDCIVFHPTRSDFRSILIKNNRLLGGCFSLAKENGGLAVFKLFIRTALPPITAFKMAAKYEGQPVKNKIKAMVISYYIKLTGLLELIRLFLYKKKAERV